jgi:hypothetical protein
MSSIINNNLLKYLVFSARLTKAQAEHLSEKCTSFNEILMIKYQDADYEKCEGEITAAIMKYVTLLCDKYKTGWEPKPNNIFVYEEKEIAGVCFGCGVEGKFIGDEGDDWLCVDCSSLSEQEIDEEEEEEEDPKTKPCSCGCDVIGGSCDKGLAIDNGEEEEEDEEEEKIIKPCCNCSGSFEISEIVKISKKDETEKWICCECNAKKIMECECCDDSE